MKVALLLRGPVRLNPAAHATLIKNSYDTVSRLSSAQVEPHLLTYTRPSAPLIEEALDYRTIIKVREPTDDDIVEAAGTDDILHPFPNGGSRINAYKQYFLMSHWANIFRLGNSGCTMVFYVRTDVALELSPSASWFNEKAYTTAHAIGVNGAWTCDYVGCAPVDIFCDVWDMSCNKLFIDSMLAAKKGEDPLDYSLATKRIQLEAAEMKFGGHLIRNDADLERFFTW